MPVIPVHSGWALVRKSLAAAGEALWRVIRFALRAVGYAVVGLLLLMFAVLWLAPEDHAERERFDPAAWRAAAQRHAPGNPRLAMAGDLLARLERTRPTLTAAEALLGPPELERHDRGAAWLLGTARKGGDAVFLEVRFAGDGSFLGATLIGQREAQGIYRKARRLSA